MPVTHRQESCTRNLHRSTFTRKEHWLCVVLSCTSFFLYKNLASNTTELYTTQETCRHLSGSVNECWTRFEQIVFDLERKYTPLKPATQGYGLNADLYTALRRGLDSARLRTVRGWMPFYVVVNDSARGFKIVEFEFRVRVRVSSKLELDEVWNSSATAAVTLQLWQKWLRKRTKSYLATFYQTTIMSYNSTYLSDRARSTLGHELATKHW